MANATDDTGADLFEGNEELLAGGELLPNEAGSAVFGEEDDDEDEDERQLRQEEQDERFLMRSASSPLLEALDNWFDNEIAATDSVQAAVKLAKDKGISREDALVAFDVVRELLQGKKDSIQTLKEIHRPELS